MSQPNQVGTRPRRAEGTDDGLKSRNAFVFVIAMVPVMAAAQQFFPAPPGPPVDPNTRFEVAVIKPVDGASGPTMSMTPSGRFDMTGMPIGILVRQALQKPTTRSSAHRMDGMERYSISAKAPEGTPPAARTMMVNLLKDRFQLAMHLETRERPIFHLVAARTNGRLGPDLKATPAECQATIAERIAAAKAAAGRGGPPPLPDSIPTGPCPAAFGASPLASRRAPVAPSRSSSRRWRTSWAAR